MVSPAAGIVEIRSLENELKSHKDDKQRLVILEKLIPYYVFTDVEKAKGLLEQQQCILKELDYADFKMNHYWNRALVENLMYNFEESEQYFSHTIDTMKSFGELLQLAEAYIDYSGTCINLNRHGLAQEYVEQAQKMLKSFPDQRLSARATCRAAFIKLFVKDYASASRLLLEADKLMTDYNGLLNLKDYYFLTIINSGLGRIYEQNGDNERSVKAYRKVVEMCETFGIRGRLSWHYLNVGKGYMALNDNENAEHFFLKAIQVTDDISQLARANAYANLGFCYFEKQMFKDALALFDRAEKLYEERPEDHYGNFSYIEFWRGKLYNEIGQRALALDHLALAFEYADKADDFRQLAEVCKFIANLYADNKEFESAYNYQALFEQYHERFMEDVESRRERELEIKYEAQKKEREAEMLRLQATELQLKALRAQMNPHFMYNALNSIQDYITSNEITNASKYLAKFANLMRQSLNYSDIDNIVLEKEIEFLKDYLSINEKLRYQNQFSYEITAEDDIEEDIFCVPTMIIQPYVENAIEHGLRGRNNGFISVNFSMLDDDTILCIVADNGIGREKARELQAQDASYNNHKSRGTSITEERLRLLSKKRRVFVKTIDLVDEDTGVAAGTKVEIQIPIIDIKIK